jgi:hypothetical protein
MPAAPPPGDLWTNADAGTEAVEKLVSQARRRLLRRSAGWWRTEGRGGRRRDDVVRDTVAALAAADPTTEGRTPPRPSRADVLADQLAVVGHDVVLALRERYDADTARHAAERLAAMLDDVDPRT